MTIAICTLFEGSYHYGVAALSNSLYKNGYRGTVYAGYRGRLPQWVESSIRCSIDKWDDAIVIDVAVGFRLVLLSLDTDSHLTNFKPDFMLDLIDGPAGNADALIYFDPDICVTKHWTFFEQWITCGVALCEDINSPLPENHPRRVGWRRYFQDYGFSLRFRSIGYANGGFVGVSRQDFDFLRLWKKLQISMAEEIGGLSASKLVNGNAYRSKGFADCFEASDQDALNAAIEATSTKISLLGQEAMGFKHGGAVALHALGPGKPWQRSYIREAIKGRPPRRVDKQFWQSVSSPLRPYPAATIFFHQLWIILATAIGRIYRSNE